MDLTRWGPILAGAVGSLAILAFLMTLGIVLGLVAGPGVTPAAAPSPTAVGIWTALSTAVAFFVGGWLCSRTSTVTGSGMALFEGFMVWAVGLIGVLVLSLAGLGAIFGALGLAFGPGGLPPAGITVPAETGTTAAVLTLIMMVIGIAAAVVGSVVGTNTEMAEIR